MSKKVSTRLFRPGDKSAALLRAWWKDLDRDRGERALLRRLSSPTEVVFSPAYHRLLGQLQQHEYIINRVALAAIAGLSAHVKVDTGPDKSVAKLMASPGSSANRAKISGLRFRRLLAINQRDELYPYLIRVIRMLNFSVDLLDLANSVYWWNEKTRMQWAYDYYETAPDQK